MDFYNSEAGQQVLVDSLGNLYAAAVRFYAGAREQGVAVDAEMLRVLQETEWILQELKDLRRK
jgi:hypothetical protein